MNNTTDALTVKMAPSSAVGCMHRGRHDRVAIISGSVDGWYIERQACASEVRYYTTQTVVNSRGEIVPVTVR